MDQHLFREGGQVLKLSDWFLARTQSGRGVAWTKRAAATAQAGLAVPTEVTISAKGG